MFKRFPWLDFDARPRWFAPAVAIAYSTYRGQECNAYEIASCVLIGLAGGIFSASLVHVIQAMRSELADRADGLTTQQLLDPES